MTAPAYIHPSTIACLNFFSIHQHFRASLSSCYPLLSDVDAITRLCNDISAVEYTREKSFSMAKGTWCPFNSQNTAISRSVIPAYCLSPRVGRYDDIWASYVCLAIMDK